MENKNNIEEIKNVTKNIIEISAKEKIGIEKLEEKIYEMCNIEKNIKENEIVLINSRHKNVVFKALKILDDIFIELNKKTPIDMISVQIMSLLEIIGEITGKTVSEEIINKIFSKFCLGK